MLDDLIEKAKQKPVPWNDLVEQRVWEKVTHGIETPSSSRKRPALMAALVIAVASAVVIWVRQSTAPVANTLALSDGSVATLSEGARLEVDAQSLERVALMQRAGTVRYDVTVRPQRVFSVRARDIEVRVLGTVFAVAMEPDATRIEVLRGRVEVRRGDLVRVLNIGETLRISAAQQASSEPERMAPQSSKRSTTVTAGELERERPRIRATAQPSAPPPAAHLPPAMPDSAHKATNSAHAPPEAVAVAPSLERLLEEADAARSAGRLSDAAGALREIIRLYPTDSRTVGASFTLGRVERAAGHHALAAAAFESAWRLAPRGALAEDALAEAAFAAAESGDVARARTAARTYVEAFPSGAYFARMAQLAQ